ncbi:PREDICTED: protein scribble homolog, partial [Priapulus caudatus]|uniref:Protein scribble homolog n=1 Tax=Priapulus caudatus TaxID=37621 RepID=A0ABM1F3S5_PRICU
MNHLDPQDYYKVEEIILQKAGGPLGFSIVGGVDHSSHPFGLEEPGIFISKIVPGGSASQTKLRIGDRILSVNGIDLTKATHQDAVMALVSPVQSIALQAQHDPPPKGLQEMKIRKAPGENLGISIKGGAHSHPGNPLDRTDEGVFVSRINPVGAVHRDRRLRLGMRILEVNGQSLLGASHQEAVRALRSVGDAMFIMVCEGYDPAEAEKVNPEFGVLHRSKSDSVSSIDRADYEEELIRRVGAR